MSIELKDEQLQNGVRLITEHNPAIKSASLGLWAKVGSRDEGDGVWGCSHFIEHLLFKGTETRTAQEISSTIENRGGNLNAFTDRDMTAYHARVMSDDLVLAADVLQDMYHKSTLRDNDIENERQVILEEIKQLEDDPASLIHELYLENIWRDSQLAHSIAGTAETIQEMSPDMIRGYYARHYGEELTVVASGRVDHEKLAQELERFAEKGLGKPVRNRVKPDHNTGRMFVNRDTGQVQLCIATEGVPYGHSEMAAQTIVSSYLGLGASSKLFQEVRERRGLVYNIYTHSQALEDVGALGVFAGTRKTNLREVTQIVLTELEAVKHGLDPTVLEEVKHKTVGHFILGSESNRQRMHQLGVSTLRSGKPRTVDEAVAKLNAVTCEDVCRIAERLFDPNKLSVTALGVSLEDSQALTGLI
ncbi:insulinase family protein [Candidatus Bathyarchaeota archaeon]|nr:insulinase family protein [Candidatus Bathyarchaeota archaeon]